MCTALKKEFYWDKYFPRVFTSKFYIQSFSFLNTYLTYISPCIDNNLSKLRAQELESGSLYSNLL